MILNTLEKTYFLNVTISRSILEFCSLKRKHVTFNSEFTETARSPNRKCASRSTRKVLWCLIWSDIEYYDALELGISPPSGSTEWF